jgi:molybdopterin-containing oxidoreductase family membrane subunit
MWLERFMLVVTSLYHTYIPSEWGMFYPTLWDWTFLFGSMGVFASFYLLFVRLLPVIAIAEMRKLVRKNNTGERL